MRNTDESKSSPRQDSTTRHCIFPVDCRIANCTTIRPPVCCFCTATRDLLLEPSSECPHRLSLDHSAHSKTAQVLLGLQERKSIIVCAKGTCCLLCTTSAKGTCCLLSCALLVLKGHAVSCASAKGTC